MKPYASFVDHKVSIKVKSYGHLVKIRFKLKVGNYYETYHLHQVSNKKHVADVQKIFQSIISLTEDLLEVNYDADCSDIE